MRIKITEELRDYVERLNFEETRYKDLLSCIHRDIVPMTNEEWESSLGYYRNLIQEACVSKQTAMETIKEIYGFTSNDWWINFYTCEVVVDEPMDLGLGISFASKEPYLDYMVRLYPEYREELAINSKHTKNITFQVTENCNLKCTYCYQHNKSQKSMSFDTAKKFVDMILDADELTNTYIDSWKSNGAMFEFIGGEPWLEIDLINNISDYIIGELFRRKHPWALKFMFVICSNGLLHFDNRVQKYIKNI